MAASRYVGFALDDMHYALALASVERVIHAVAVTPLPDAPDVIIGVINVRGKVVPVADIRSRFGLASRDIACSDHIVVAQSARRTLALVADTVVGVLEYADSDIVPTQALIPGMAYIEGIVRTRDGFVLIHDLDRLLSLDEQISLRQALDDD